MEEQKNDKRTLSIELDNEASLRSNMLQSSLTMGYSSMNAP